MTERALIADVAGRTPHLDPAAFTAPTSVVLGDVTLAAGASVWYHTVLRGDCESISVGEGSNVQDNSTVHADPGFPAVIGAGVTVGHNAVLHGCVVEDDVLIGMGATVLNGAHIGTARSSRRVRSSPRACGCSRGRWWRAYRRRCAVS